MFSRPYLRLQSIVLGLVILGAGFIAGSGPITKKVDTTRITLGVTAWPGWLPWQVAKERKLFARHGVNVELKYYSNYTDSLLALETGALDANSQTLNDTLISVSAGAKEKIVLVNDNSTGNDKIIAHGGITSVAGLKGRKIAVVQGTANHYLLLLAIKQSGLDQKDVKLQPQSTGEAAAAAFAAGEVDAVSASAPFTTKALQRSGSHAIATSVEFPGAIPNHLVVRPDLIDEHPELVQAMVDTWFDTLEWIKNHKEAAIDIMAKASGVGIDEYKTYAAGTTLFTRRQALDAFTPGTTPKHLNHQAAQIAEFIVDAGMVEKRPSSAGLLDERFVKQASD
ncbi:ABC transporter substrate-binding protein [Streptomyces sp. KR80]|uniref:ABC transporter substrate-binding protein n=1 Tax=Streptomyces sp. KR80 TaxID=3457426 RepID=UPI003FD67177